MIYLYQLVKPDVRDFQNGYHQDEILYSDEMLDLSVGTRFFYPTGKNYFLWCKQVKFISEIDETSAKNIVPILDI